MKQLHREAWPGHLVIVHWKLHSAAEEMLKVIEGMLEERLLDGHAHSGMTMLWNDKAEKIIIDLKGSLNDTSLKAKERNAENYGK